MTISMPPDTCPRCGGGFVCGMAGPGPCACTTLTLSAQLQATLRAHYIGCLCIKCLGELTSGADPLPGAPRIAATASGSSP